MLSRLILAATFLFSTQVYADIHETVISNEIDSIEIASEFSENLELQRRRPPHHRTYFDWGRGRDGTGYCYEFFRNGHVANGGQAVPNRLCERVNPSYYDYGRGRDGFYYCYQFTPYGLVMNQGRAVPERFCRY